MIINIQLKIYNTKWSIKNISKSGEYQNEIYYYWNSQTYKSDHFLSTTYFTNIWQILSIKIWSMKDYRGLFSKEHFILLKIVKKLTKSTTLVVTSNCCWMSGVSNEFTRDASSYLREWSVISWIYPLQKG